MIAFVMAYSFSEDQESPSMIPMADMLNHHSNNNANLIFERNALKMISCRKIDKVPSTALLTFVYRFKKSFLRIIKILICCLVV